MSQISRLHDTEIANGNLIDATHLNAEFDQLVSESNSQDTRLTSAEATQAVHANSFQLMMNGLVVDYNTANRVVIKPGACRDASNTELMEVSANITVDLSASGANGLDTGAEASNTWYYVWLIKNSSTGTVAGLFSTSSSNPTMPTGYNKKRLLPIAVRNDASSNIIPFSVGAGWPQRPVIHYKYADISAPYLVLNGGTATTAFTNPGGGTNVDLSSMVPPISKEAILNAHIVWSSTSGNFFIKNPDSPSTQGQAVAGQNGVNNQQYNTVYMTTNASQQIAYRTSNSGAPASLSCWGYVVTEV